MAPIERAFLTLLASVSAITIELLVLWPLWMRVYYWTPDNIVLIMVATFVLLLFVCLISFFLLPRVPDDT